MSTASIVLSRNTEMDPVVCTPVPVHEVSTDIRCVVCGYLRTMFTSREMFADLGLLDEVLKTPCPGHDPLLRFIRKKFSGSGSESETAETGSMTETAYNLKLNRQKGEPYGVIAVATSPEEISPLRLWEVLLAKSNDEREAPTYGRVLNPDWIDVDLIKQWKNQCAIRHGEKCHNPFKIPHVSPAWLIDTIDNCLVCGDGISEFVALSYRWGASTGFRTDIDKLDKLQKPQALREIELASAIPPSIKDAIGLVRAIDERYLWVDAICLVKDDQAQIKNQLQLMGSIYASAKMTIVLADGDATDGIRGLKGISGSRGLSQTVIPIFQNDKVIFMSTPIMSSCDGAFPYFERGWTFQEFYLSRRRLIFMDNRIHWSCACEDWYEDLIYAEGEVSHVSLFSWQRPPANILAGQPDFKELGELMSEYKHRKFTYPEDAQPGLAGLLHILSRSFEGGFLFGLPETCFDSALMWSTFFPIDLQRRMHSGRTDSLLPGSYLPFWSWISWKSWAMQVLREETYAASSLGGFRTTPITQWYTHNTPDSMTKRAIRSTWFNFHENIKDPVSDLPEGWKKEEYDPGKHVSESGEPNTPPEGLGKHVYRHPTLPGKWLWRPVPLAAIHEHAKPFSPPQTPYISCETKRGWFAATRFPVSQFKEHEIAYRYHLFAARLTGSNRRYSGELHLQTADDIFHFPEADCTSSVTIELVAICIQRRPVRGLIAHREYQETTTTTWADFYAVLWVEWIDGVAYRKASGYVHKESWEAHELEDVHLVLG